MRTATIAETFAAWASSLAIGDIPDDVAGHATAAVTDTVALMVAGARTSRVSAFGQLATAEARAGGATVAGTRGKTRVQDAAFANAIYAHSSELDDVFVGAGGHPGAVVVPAALAVAEHLGSTGGQLLTAVVAGYEVMHRSIQPMFPGTQRRGFQGTGLAGPFGAAAAAGSLCRLDAAALAEAFGVAGCYSCGLMEYDQAGGECKRLYAGLGARAGVEAVTLAAAGVTGPLTIYEGRRGVFRSFSDSSDPGAALDGLGESFRIATHRHVKPYPVVTSIHGALDALRVLVPAPVPAGAIRRVTITVPPLALSHGGAVRVPADTLSAQFSFAFAVAVWVLTGTVDVAWFEDAAFRQSAGVAAVCSAVELEADPALGPDAQQGGATVRVEFADGTVRTRAQPVPAGRPDNPLSEQEMRARFDRLTVPVLGPDRSARLLDALWRLREAPAVDELAALLRDGGDDDR